MSINVPSGACRSFYLIYDVDYFYEFLVHTSNPAAVGYISNWDEGQVFDERITESNPVTVTAEVKPHLPSDGGPIPDDWEYYYVDLTVLSSGPDTLVIW